MAYIRQAWMYYVTMKLQQNAENITIIFPFDGLTHLYFITRHHVTNTYFEKNTAEL